MVVNSFSPVGHARRSELTSILRGHRRTLLHIGVFSGVVNVLMLAPALYMLQVYDRVLASGNEMTLLMLTLILLMLFGFMGALDWVRSLVMLRLGAGVDRTLAPRVFDAAFSVSLRTGRPIAGQPLEDVQQLRQFVTGQSLFAFFDAPWFPVYLLVMFCFHPLLGWFALASTLLLMLMGWLNEHLSRPHLQRAGEWAMASRRDAIANLRNAEAIAAMGMLGRLRERWARQHGSYVQAQNQASVRMSGIQGANKVLRMAVQSLALGLGAWLVLRQQITAGMMIAGSILLGRALAPIDQLVGVSRQWTAVKEAYKRLGQLLDASPVPVQGMDFSGEKGALAVEQLWAAPPSQSRAVLHGVNFRLTAGRTLAVIGPSGAGKSTLARCLVNAWQPLRGTIRLDEAPLEQWRLESLGDLVGYLPQDVQLFAGTVAENIARFTEVAESEIIAAAQMAGVHELILHLPDGYGTQLGENGSGLSGGQRQRIGLARALFGHPVLVVLDEPNSNLDEAGAAMLMQAIGRIKAARMTLVVMTHDIRLLRLADSVLVLGAGGAQVDFGPLAEVVGRMRQAGALRPAEQPLPQVSEQGA